MNKRFYITLFSVISISLLSCTDTGSKKEGNVHVLGNLENGSGKMLILEQFVNNQPISVDTCILDENGTIDIAFDAENIDFYRLKTSPQNTAIMLLAPNEEIQLTGNANDLTNSLTIEGSENTKLLWNYYKEASSYGKNSQELRTKAQGLTPEQGDDKQVVIDQFNTLNSDFLEYTKTFISENSSSPAILSALGNLKIESDIDYFIIARDGLKTGFGESNFYKSLDQQIEQEVAAKEKAKMFDPGNEVPNITQNDPSGNPKSLSDLRGSVVLVDFWASWCRPCRAENPNVVRLYNKYHNDGFDIFSVSLDKTQDKWVKAIEADGLVWENHVSDLQYWSSEAAKLYGVKSIPFTVLIDREGKVINSKLRGPALEAKLKEIFGY